MRLIDVDVLLEVVEDRYLRACVQAAPGTRRNGKSIYYGIAIGMNFVRNTINEQPTIDAVEVVRCKDCIAFGKQPEYLRGVIRPDTGLCMYTGEMVLPDDFCSNAAEIDRGAEDD